jgi:hypothetical protein
MTDLHALLYQALTTPHGLVVTAQDLDALVRKLYPVRKSNPIFEALHFIRFDPELWIVKDATGPNLETS